MSNWRTWNISCGTTIHQLPRPVQFLGDRSSQVMHPCGKGDGKTDRYKYCRSYSACAFFFVALFRYNKCKSRNRSNGNVFFASDCVLFAVKTTAYKWMSTCSVFEDAIRLNSIDLIKIYVFCFCFLFWCKVKCRESVQLLINYLGDKEFQFSII